MTKRKTDGRVNKAPAPPSSALKRAILDALDAASWPLRAQEIFTAIRPASPNVATVRYALVELLASGEVEPVDHTEMITHAGPNGLYRTTTTTIRRWATEATPRLPKTEANGS